MLDLRLVAARTVATTVLVLVGLYLIVALEASGRKRGAAVSLLCLALLAVYVLVLVVPFGRRFFELAAPSPAVLAPAIVGALVSVVGLWLTDDRFHPGGLSEAPKAV